MIKVALVDDHTLFRNGLKGLLQRRRDIKVVAEFSDGSEFIAALPTLEVDIVFMDISMPYMSGEKATRLALQQRAELKIIALSMFGEEQYYRSMAEAGAYAFLLKDSDIDTVFDAIARVMEGEKLFSEFSVPQHNNDNDSLSEREIAVLKAICDGFSTPQIAEQLSISKRTVDAHRARILEKTGCNNTASLVVYAIREKLVEI